MGAKAKPKIYGTGLIALDIVVGPTQDAPIRTWAGGTCGNVLSILSYLGWDAYPITRMNSDTASTRVRADMAAWGVHLDHTRCEPATHTPIIVQQIEHVPNGSPRHRFSWSCPYCGKWLPSFRPITRSMAAGLRDTVKDPSVFFFDRVSRGALNLAQEASRAGALVVFEPSASTRADLMLDATRVAHVVKYADGRLDSALGAMGEDSATLVEIQTLGETGMRYRHRMRRTVSNWIYLKAARAPHVADTCGAGDWCTAGFVDQIARGGQESFSRAGALDVRAALRFGQALAAWNCGFEGARGSMYAVTRRTLDRRVAGMRNGEPCSPAPARPPTRAAELVQCPACSSERMHTHHAK